MPDAGGVVIACSDDARAIGREGDRVNRGYMSFEIGLFLARFGVKDACVIVPTRSCDMTAIGRKVGREHHVLMPFEYSVFLTCFDIQNACGADTGCHDEEFPIGRDGVIKRKFISIEFDVLLIRFGMFLTRLGIPDASSFVTAYSGDTATIRGECCGN